MKTTLGQLRQMIRRGLFEAPRAQGTADDPYGKYLFAPQRTDLPATAKGEKNTPEEKELWDALQAHYENMGYYLGDLAPGILDLVKQGKYAKLLAPPGGPYYRLVSDIPIDVFAGWVKKKPESIKRDVATTCGGGRMTPGGTDAGSTGIHSWTVNEDTSNLGEVIYGPVKKGTVTAVLRASDGGGKFFIDPAGMALVPKMSRYVAAKTSQGEVISFGPVKFEAAAYYAAGKAPAEDKAGIAEELFSMV